MHPYSRPSPRTASPANNLQTNPTRTNNQRHNSQDMTAYSTTPPYNDRGVEEAEGEMMSRGEQSAESDQRHYVKVNQVIQVHTVVVRSCSGHILNCSRITSRKLLSRSYHLE
jgi:autophagy-related protein 13